MAAQYKLYDTYTQAIKTHKKQKDMRAIYIQTINKIMTLGGRNSLSLPVCPLSPSFLPFRVPVRSRPLPFHFLFPSIPLGPYPPIFSLPFFFSP